MSITAMRSGWFKLGACLGIGLFGATALQQACAVKDCPDDRIGFTRCVGNEIETCGDGNQISYDSCTGRGLYCVDRASGATCVSKLIWEMQGASTAATGTMSASTSHASSSSQGGMGGHGGMGGMGGVGGMGGMGGGMMLPPINGCTFDKANDLRKAPAPLIEYGDNGNIYSPACAWIKVGQSVTWNSLSASFSFHPLVGGTVNLAAMTLSPDKNSPIVPISSGTKVTYTFNQSGEFGFYCSNHALSGMFGAVFVTAQ